MNSKDNINKRKELLRSCLYFGRFEEDQLTGNKAMLYFYERCWFERSITGDQDQIFSSEIAEYKAAGLEHFEEQDQRAISLKALLFNRYGRTLSAPIQVQAERFKDFYLDHYFSLHNDPCMEWNTDPIEKRICQSCLNRLRDGSCEECSPVEQSAALINNSCKMYLKRHSESV